MTWMRLSAYCAQQNESPDAISKRIRAGHWLAGVHVRKPPGSKERWSAKHDQTKHAKHRSVSRTSP